MPSGSRPTSASSPAGSRPAGAASPVNKPPTFKTAATAVRTSGVLQQGRKSPALRRTLGSTGYVLIVESGVFYDQLGNCVHFSQPKSPRSVGHIQFIFCCFIFVSSTTGEMTVSVTTVTDRSFSGTSVTERTLSESEEEESVTEEGSKEEEEEESNWGSEG